MDSKFEISSSDMILRALCLCLSICTMTGLGKGKFSKLEPEAKDCISFIKLNSADSVRNPWILPD